jgi:fluoride exporter
MSRVLTVLIVCGGSALGGGLRYLVALWTTTRGWTPSSSNPAAAFPWATLFVNVVGCFFIMLVSTIAARRTMSTDLRLFLTTGIMGGLTTYSTFDAEATNFIHGDRAALAAVYVGVTLVACFGAGLVGRALVD